MKGCNAEYYRRLDVEFAKVWNESDSVQQVADHFGRTHKWASDRSTRVRGKGYELKSMRYKPRRRIDCKEFIRVWNDAKSIVDVSEQLQIGFDDARRKAKQLRTKGYKLKSFVGTNQVLAVAPLKPPADYCCWAPGSREKIETMRMRINRNEEAFHPLDATFSRSLNPHWQQGACAE